MIKQVGCAETQKANSQIEILAVNGPIGFSVYGVDRCGVIRFTLWDYCLSRVFYDK